MNLPPIRTNPVLDAFLSEEDLRRIMGAPLPPMKPNTVYRALYLTETGLELREVPPEETWITR